MARIVDRLVTRIARGVVMVCGFVAVMAVPAQGQCEPTWLGREEAGLPGVDGEVFCTTQWDPDGSGPERLVMGGSFSVAGNVLAHCVAWWDGEEWHSLAERITTQEHPTTGGPKVFAMTVFENDLIIGGNFDTIDGVIVNGVARWDGERWHAMGNGFLPWTSGAVPMVHALRVYKGELFAGGRFALPGEPRYALAKWTGSSWGTVGTWIGNGVSSVMAMFEFEETLVIAGRFEVPVQPSTSRDLVGWDGENWRIDYSPQTLNPGGIFSLGEYQGELVAGGGFFSLSSGIQARHIARWSGTRWEPFGDGVMSFAPEEGVRAISVYEGELFVGGSLKHASGPCGVQRWTGSEWVPVGVQRVIPWGSPARRIVNTLLVHDEALFVGGDFLRADDAPARSIAAWNGESWNGLGSGTDRAVLCYTRYKDELYCGGDYRLIDGRLGPGVSRWDGESWHPVGEDVNIWTSALIEFEGDLIAGGTMVGSGLPLGTRVARWDGVTWTPVGPAFNGRVEALAVYHGEIVALGYFTQIAGEPVNYIARWDGEAWRELGGGLTGLFSPFSQMDMAVFEGELYVAGALSTAGGVSVRRIARWNGTDWRDVGGGTSATVHALALHGGRLYAGGVFTEAGGVATSRIASWDGQQWHPIEVGPGLSVYALASHGSDLIAGGAFLRVGALPVNQIARWDGQQWHAMDEGAGYYVEALASYNGDLFVGGSFSTAGGMASSNWARWGCRPCYADCDESTGRGVLDIFDFLCFGNAFAANDPYACDCDLATGPGVCDIFDFLCFGNAFHGGCL